MKFVRTLGMLALAAAMAAPFAARAEYPNRPVTVVIPLGAGGSHDLHARGITSIINTYLGQPMIVSLMPGGAGMKGTTFVAKARPDGYTILFTHNALDQLVPQVQQVSFKPQSDFVTICQFNKSEPILIVRADSPWKTVGDFVDYAKSHPGEVNFGHSGVWGASHIPTAQFIKAAGIKVNLIPHQGGGPQLQALLAGEDAIGFSFATQARPHMKSGKIRALAISGDSRLKDDPDFGNVPSMAEAGYPQVDFTMERIFMAPAKIAPENLKVLRAAFAKLVTDPSLKSFIKNIGENINYMPGEEYDAKIRGKRFSQYAELIKEVGSK